MLHESTQAAAYEGPVRHEALQQESLSDAVVAETPLELEGPLEDTNMEAKPVKQPSIHEVYFDSMDSGAASNNSQQQIEDAAAMLENTANNIFSQRVSGFLAESGMTSKGLSPNGASTSLDFDDELSNGSSSSSTHYNGNGICKAQV